MSDKVRIFSCGSQYADWSASNCSRCKKSVQVWGNPNDWPTCEIEEALLLAYVDDGTITPEMAARAGRTDENRGKYVWMCNEVDWTESWKAECKTGVAM